MAKSKVLVTGHLGFIGSHLYRSLKELDFDVWGIDLKDEADLKDVRHLFPEDLLGTDYVFHCAAMPKVPLSIERPEFTHTHNVDGTFRLLLAAKDAHVKKVIYSASSSAYGEQNSLPLKEDMVPNPMNPYAVQKLIGEHYCKVFSNVYGLPTVSLRYFNVYGEDMPIDNAYSACIAKFLDSQKKGWKLSVYGGKQTRDFTYVGDVVMANILAMGSDKVGKGEVINIGGGKNYSIEEIAKTISKDIDYMDYRKGEAMNTLADISKAKELLNWEPTTNVLDWLKEQCVQ